MSKNKSIEETYNENKKSIEELITQLKLVGVKDKTIEKMLNEIAEYQRKLYIKQNQKNNKTTKKQAINQKIKRIKKTHTIYNI